MTIRSNGHGLRRLGVVLGVALGVLGLSPVSEAQVVYIDFGDSSGSEGGNWNTVSAGIGPVDLVDWNTGLSVGWDPISVGWDSESFSGWNTSTPGNWAGAASAGDSIAVKGTNQDLNLVFNNVDSNQTYTIDIISYASNLTFFQASDITVNGNFADSDAKGLGLNGDDYDPLAAGANGNWLTFNNVVAGGGVGPGQPGQFTISLDETDVGAVPNPPMFLSAIRITAVPEPSTAMLLGLGIAGVFRRRRRANRCRANR